MAGGRVSEEFALVYDGPALDEHRMSVRDLAPALLGFADAIERAQQLVAPDFPVRLEVQATTAASFDIVMLLRDVPEIYRHSITLLTSPGMTAAIAVKEIIEAVVAAVGLAVHRKRRGRPVVDTTTPASDASFVRLRFPDGTVMEVTGAAWAIYQDGQAMVGLREAAKPLSPGAVETLAIRHQGSSEVVEAVDRDAFDIDESDATVLLDRVDPMMLQPVDITFRPGGKWKVYNGISRFGVRVEDQQFADRVEKGIERFGKSDIIHAQVRTVQSQTPDGLRTDYTIVKVLNHAPGGVQGALDLSGPDES